MSEIKLGRVKQTLKDARRPECWLKAHGFKGDIKRRIKTLKMDQPQRGVVSFPFAKSTEIYSTGMVWRKGNPPVAGGEVKWCSHYGKWLRGSPQSYM